MYDRSVRPDRAQAIRPAVMRKSGLTEYDEMVGAIAEVVRFDSTSWVGDRMPKVG